MVGFIETTPEELKAHKEKYGNDWEKHTISRISTDPEEARHGFKGYFCPCCGLLYDFSNHSHAQNIYDKEQGIHINTCSSLEEKHDGK